MPETTALPDPHEPIEPLTLFPLPTALDQTHSLEHLHFWRGNTLYAAEMWATIPPDNVAPGLAYWRREVLGDGSRVGLSYRQGLEMPHSCNTIACFGGWVSAMPKFQEMGVTVDQTGAPAVRLDPGTHHYLQNCAIPGEESVDEALFGESTMFAAEGDCLYDLGTEGEFAWSHGAHALVAQRLAKHLDAITARIAELHERRRAEGRVIKAAFLTGKPR